MGITFGYLSYTEHTNGLPTASGAAYGVVYLDDRETIASRSPICATNCDVLIVSAHSWAPRARTEINDFTEADRPNGWLYQGVDVIIGTTPLWCRYAEC